MNQLDDERLDWPAYVRLAEILAESRSLPILFVGSGISQRYTGAPSWAGLVRNLCELAGQNAQYILSSSDGDYAGACSILAPIVHEFVWKDEGQSEFRERYMTDLSFSDSALKCSAVDVLLQRSEEPEIDEIARAEIDLLKHAKIAGIITTNYDTFVENLFSQFKVFIGQASMLLSNPLGVAEIYKIHGCVTLPNTLVLTTEDYSRYDRDNPYLLAKLLSIFVEHPVVFLGYSIQDPNIRSILQTLGKIAARNQLLDLTGKIVFVEWERSGKDPELSDLPLVIDDVSIPITRITVPNFIDVFQRLAAAKTKLPMRVIRQFQEHIYEIVKGQVPTGKITVMGLDQVEDFREVEWAVGLGVRSVMENSGYLGIGRNDIIKDFLKDEPEYDANILITSVLPRFASNSAQYVPVYYYLRGAGFITESEELALPEAITKRIEKYLKSNLQNFLPREGNTRAHQNRWQQYGPSPQRVVESASFATGVTTLSLNYPDRLSSNQVREFLVESMDTAMVGDSCNSSWAKLVAQLDFVEFAPKSYLE